MSARPSLAPIGPHALHVVCDMQRLFAEDTAWCVPSMSDIVPRIVPLVEAHPSRTVFTRFVMPPSAAVAEGCWRRYYEHWPSVTLDRMDPAVLDLVAPLAGLARAGEICDKTTYSAFASDAFVTTIRRRQPDTLIFTGVETDVCVLASVLGAVDRGYRVVIATDAVASSSAAGHRATMKGIWPRFDQQIEVATADRVLAAWAGE
jgi:nicotinamidase-related amidase